MRIATFNLENLGGNPAGDPDLGRRLRALRPDLIRLKADILCLQEINADNAGAARTLGALDALLEGTPYAEFHRAVTQSGSKERPRDVHNLVILSRYRISAQRQVQHDFVTPPRYRMSTAEPRPGEPEAVRWDRPILHAEIDAASGRTLHVINVHLRAPLSTAVAGQKTGAFSWVSVAGWAEGFYLSALKRNGQALELRLLIDRIFDRDANAWIAACGDFNSAEREVPVATVRGDVEDTGNPGLAARIMRPLEAALPESRRFTVRHAGRKVALDHILVSPALLAQFDGVEAYNLNLRDEMSDFEHGVTPAESHHAPLLAQFCELV